MKIVFGIIAILILPMTGGSQQTRRVDTPSFMRPGVLEDHPDLRSELLKNLTDKEWELYKLKVNVDQIKLRQRYEDSARYYDTYVKF